MQFGETRQCVGVIVNVLQRSAFFYVDYAGRNSIPAVIGQPDPDARCGQTGKHLLADVRDGRPIRRICVQSQDGRELQLGDLMWMDASEAAETEQAA